MVVSSTLVNVSDDAEVRLVAMVAEAAYISSNFAARCQKCIDAGEAGGLLDAILSEAPAMELILTMEDADEASAAVALMAALLDRAGRPVSAVSKAIVAAGGAAERKITLLSVLYNMRQDDQEKMALLTQMFELAASTPMLAEDATLGRLLAEETGPKLPVPGGVPSKPHLVAMLDSWNVKPEQRRDIYRTIASVMPIEDVRKQRFLVLWVETYSSASADSTTPAKEAAIGAIRDPVSLFVHQRNMLALPAIQGLAKSDAQLLALLKVFQEGKLSDYEAYLQSHGGEDTLKQWGLDVDACNRNIRILSLCSLASEHEEIPYSTVASTLQLPSEAEVETWVIAAVSSGLLQAKMDQLKQKVMVERSVVRQFGPDQWKALQSRLRLWKKNVGGVLSGLKESQGAAAATKP